MNISIKQRIYWSFSLLVYLFVFSGIITILTINSNKKIATNIFKVIAPSIQALDDFNKMMFESKTYTSNWVFLRSNQEDKKLLIRLHDSGYAALKSRLNGYSLQWKEKNWIDSLNRIYTGFEELLAMEKEIMGSLQVFKDYDDPVIKLEAERKVEEEILPRTTALMNSLKAIQAFSVSTRTEKGAKLESSSTKLRILIIVLAITIILAGFLLSLYMTRLIIRPVNRIRYLIDNLGKGIIQKIDHYHNRNEIGMMVQSVNNLSEKLQATATFAQQIGLRNYEIAFHPLSEKDILGKALIVMRDNIRSSDEKLNQAQLIAHIGSWERDINTNQIILSDEMFSIFEIDRLSFDFQFQSIMSFIHPDDREYVMGVSRKNLYSNPIPYECRIVTSKGTVKNVWVETKLVLGKNGDVEKTFGILQDITQRKKSQNELEVVNRELSILFNSIDEIFFSVNMTTLKVIQVSASCEKVYGYKQSEFLSDYRLWLDVIHPGDRHIIDNEDKIMRKGEQINNQYRIICRDKTIRWVETKIIPTLNEEGNLIRVDGVTRDISERKKAETELHKSEERYRQIVETAQEGIWMIDENNYTILVNKKMAELLEYSPGEMIGKQNYCFMDDEWKGKASEHSVNRKSGMNENHEFKYVTKNGKDVWTNLSTNPVFDDAGTYKGALAMVTDITKRKHDDELLQRSQVSLAINNHELEQKNKELEQFAYVASHDMQEPLRTTSSFVALLQQQYYGKLDKKADKYLTYILQASDRMQALIKDLLEFSRIGRKKEIEQVDCNIMLNEVLDDLDVAIAEARAEITTGPLPVISGYPVEIKQLFQNLVMNAIKFSKKDISPQIKISAGSTRGYWEFAFADNGIGISKQYNERIFVIFQRLHTRNEYPGSGIGLSHCKKIVELHKGKIWLESEPGQGATFYFTIPKTNNK